MATTRPFLGGEERFAVNDPVVVQCRLRLFFQTAFRRNRRYRGNACVWFQTFGTWRSRRACFEAAR